MTRTQTDRLQHVRPLAIAATLAVIVTACATDAEPTAVPTEAPLASAASDAATGTTSGLLSASVAGTEPGPAPELVDLVKADGTSFDLADHAGANTLLFFGYTHCPDVCPATIGEIFGVFEAAPETHAVFVSVDPERDTPEHLSKWTRYFPPQFEAVTGSPGAIRRAADEYGVKYARVETTSTAGYTMSHTADVYLIDEAGQLRQTYPFGTPAEDIVADLNEGTAGPAGDTIEEGDR